MKKLLPFILVLFSQWCSAQFYVGPSNNDKDHFVYVKESLLFVSDHVHLNRNREGGAGIYLRRGAQLVQGKEQKTPNSGNGDLSLFQTGSAGPYDYNYWAAPVGNSEDKNGLFGISMFYQPQTLLLSRPASHTSALNGLSNPMTISNRWIYTFSGIDYYGWHYVGAETAIPPGYGFSMKGLEGTDDTMVDGMVNNTGGAQRYDFRGKPNSGTIEIPIASEEIVLVGNPYPSGLDLSLFLLENSGTGNLSTSCSGVIERKNATTGIAYFWDSPANGNSHYLEDYIGGYGTFSPVAPCTAGIYEPPIFQSYGKEELDVSQKGKDHDRRFLPVGQGFMVIGTGEENLSFKNAHRVFTGSVTPQASKQVQTKSKETGETVEIPKVRLLVEIDDDYVRGLTLGFWDAATPGTDKGMDAAAYELAPADVGWLHGEESFVIDVRPYDPLDEIPLFLKVENENALLTFMASEMKNWKNENLFILDTQTSTYHPIVKDSFSIELAPGNYNERFKLTFTQKLELADSPMDLGINEVEENSFSIFQNNRLGELEIISDSFFPVRSVGLYDLQGKRIFFRSNFGNRRSVSISTKNLANAIYIVEVTDTQNSRKTKKIAVLNPE